jgi:hypothetical protein
MFHVKHFGPIADSFRTICVPGVSGVIAGLWPNMDDLHSFEEPSPVMMRPEAHWIDLPAGARLAIMQHPRAGDWLDDEIAG